MVQTCYDLFVHGFLLVCIETSYNWFFAVFFSVLVWLFGYFLLRITSPSSSPAKNSVKTGTRQDYALMAIESDPLSFDQLLV